MISPKDALPGDIIIYANDVSDHKSMFFVVSYAIHNEYVTFGLLYDGKYNLSPPWHMDVSHPEWKLIKFDE